MRDFLIMIGSFALSTGVVINAFHQKKQFYPSVVYITKSSPSMAILYLQAFIMVVLLGKMMRKIFFGTLRTAEIEHLIERSWYAVTETCLAFTVFRDDFSPRFVALFTFLLFTKGFHWLAEDRIDYMERSPLISVLFHIRAIGLLLVLGFTDFYFINHAYENLLVNGPTVQLVFGFEYAILLTIVLLIFTKYVLHSVDMTSTNPWENKAVYLLYTELILGFVKVVLYLLFLGIMLRVHTFPLFVVRPMYLTIREFKKTMNDVIMSRRAIHNMNTRYEDASEEELAAMDNICIICREEMRTSAKKLPCNHIFHSACLRSWFQRQQTCPTCRTDVFRTAGSQRTNQDANRDRNPDAPPPNNNVPAPPPQPEVPQFGGGFNFNMPFPAPPTAPNLPSAGLNSSSNAGQNFSQIFPPPPPFLMPPFFLPPPFSATNMMPPLLPQFSDLTLMSDAELVQLEGQERQNVEARVRCLRDIATLLDAAVIQMQQYIDAVNRIGIGQGATEQPKVEMERQQQKQLVTDDDDDESYDGIQMKDAAETSVDQSVNEIRKRRVLLLDNDKKEKSTDCDSALIPMLCVHG